MADNFDLVVTKDSLSSIELADLGEVNVLIGPNNSGKTTVLRALQSLAYVMQMAVTGEMARYADKFIMIGGGGVFAQSKVSAVWWGSSLAISPSSSIRG